MKIQSTNINSFKGYDARPLKGFLMNCNNAGIATEMSAIGAREGFKLFSVSGHKCSEGVLAGKKRGVLNIWAQDIWTLLGASVVFQQLSKQTKAILSQFNLSPNQTQQNMREFEDCCIELKENINQKDKEIIEYSNTINCEMKVLIEKTREKKALEKDLEDLQKDIHIAGGNLFITQGENGDEILVGANELQVFYPNEIKEMYSVEKVISIPQMDYHIDLFVRPLDNKRILLADDNKTLEVFEKGLRKIQNCIVKSSDKEEQAKYRELSNEMLAKYKEFKNNIKHNNNATADEVSSVLEENGYEVIRVPGRLYSLYDDVEISKEKVLQHYLNYMNANLTKNDNGDIVYITNKSSFDKKLGLTPEISEEIDFSFEKEFIKSISPYVKKEHIYFVEGTDDYVSEEMLWKSLGGIHCACTEIPESINSNDIDKKYR